MLRISLTDHRTNESVMNEMDSDGELVSTVRKRKLQYFGHMTRTQNLCTYILKVVWIVQEAGKATETTRRLDWLDSGGGHDNSKRQEELERTDAWFRGLRSSQ